MTDPFDALRGPADPVDPDPAFAATLRARLERALALPRGVAVTETATETASATEPGVGTATRLGAAIPYLAVPAGQGRRALDWYAEVFGAELAGEPVVMPDGVLGHAELSLAGGTLYLAEEFPDLGVVAPRDGRISVSLVLAVPDADRTLAAVVRNGGQQHRPVYDDYGSRNAWVVDPFGHRWMLSSPLPAAPAGGAGYVWLTVPDAERARAFWGGLLGWEFRDGDGGGLAVRGNQVGIGTGSGHAAWHASYAVPDVAAAVERVRAAGGRSGEVEQRPYGDAADCTDDQGMDFALHDVRARAEVTGLTYLTVEVPDSAAARAFYGEVLGWQVSPGGADDGWQVAAVQPMTGLHGGRQRAAVVPMWKVDDVAAAVERVRAAGGTATDPERQPYGITAECTDDQGVRFYVGDA